MVEIKDSEIDVGRLMEEIRAAAAKREAEGQKSLLGATLEIQGLARPALIRKLCRVPVLGYLFELVTSIMRLPGLVRSQRQFEGHVITQQDVLAIHINQLSHTGFQVAESFSRELAQVSED